MLGLLNFTVAGVVIASGMRRNTNSWPLISKVCKSRRIYFHSFYVYVFSWRFSYYAEFSGQLPRTGMWCMTNSGPTKNRILSHTTAHNTAQHSESDKSWKLHLPVHCNWSCRLTLTRYVCWAQNRVRKASEAICGNVQFLVRTWLIPLSSWTMSRLGRCSIQCAGCYKNTTNTHRHVSSVTEDTTNTIDSIVNEAYHQSLYMLCYTVYNAWYRFIRFIVESDDLLFRAI